MHPVQHGSATTWPVVARDDEFTRALAALESGSEFRGVALVGDSGVGKSTLARALGDNVEVHGAKVLFVLGTQTGRDVPLGAFSRAVSVDAVHEPAVMLAAAHDNLKRQPNLVVIVDDAQLLDPLSATLVYQLAADRTARLIVTIQSGTDIPDVVATLLKERWLLNLRIKAFTREQTAELAQAVLGGAVGARLIDDLHRRASGNPLLLRGLLRSGRENGVLVRSEHGWHLRGVLRADRELFDLVEFRLRSLAPEELEAVEILATAELLDWKIMREVCDPEGVSRLERRGLIQVLTDGADMMVQLNHPVFGEAAIQLAGVVRSRQLNGILAQAFQKHLRAGDRQLRLPDLRGRIRLAQFMMRSDLPPDLDVIITAAEQAMMLANVGAAEELARFAVDHGGGLPAALILADALRWRGTSTEVEAVLAEFDPDRSDPLLTARWACLRAANLFEGCGQVDAAKATLAGVRDLVGAGPPAELVRATETSFAFFSGDAATAIETGLALCTPGIFPLATVWAAAPTSWALAFSGRLAEVGPVVEAGLSAAALGAAGPQRLIVGLAEAVALAASGDLTGAESVVERYGAFSVGMPEAEAIVDAVLGLVRLIRGELSPACAVLNRSVSLLSQGFQPGGLMLAAAWWAQAEGARGDPEAGGAALRYAEEVYGPQLAGFLPELELARGWVDAAAGQTTSAQCHALRAAQAARQSHLHGIEVRALHTAIRFGDRSSAARLVELSRTLAAPLPAAIAVHARGIVERDGDLLDEAADRFLHLGAAALAADAAAQAAQAHAHRGDRAGELKSSTRARQLAAQIDLRSPATVATARPLPITAREREIAVMVAAGLSNREIAERLSVSVRTVDGHLYRIFAKLGVQNREQLAALVDAAEPSQKTQKTQKTRETRKMR